MPPFPAQYMRAKRRDLGWLITAGEGSIIPRFPARQSAERFAPEPLAKTRRPLYRPASGSDPARPPKASRAAQAVLEASRYQSACPARVYPGETGVRGRMVDTVTTYPERERDRCIP